MQKFALAALIVASTPMFALAEGDSKSDISLNPARFSTNNLTQAPKRDTLVEISGVESNSDTVVHTLKEEDSVYLDEQDADLPKLSLGQLIKAIEDGDTKNIDRHIDYGQMHKAYLSQMNYINAKVKGLSDLVSKTAAGTFETRVREGSMMLGLLSEQIDMIVQDAAKDQDNFKRFVSNKFHEYTLVDMKFTNEVSEGLHLIEAKFPASEAADMIVITELPNGTFSLVAYIPKEVEEINDIVNRLIQSANAADTLGDELERMAITRSAIGADELLERTKKEQSALAPKESFESAIDQAQLQIAESEK
ncbi:hypothetical protein [Vibrio hepatarius]|uniref:hypothetical protein n=1 Tax=Vibrio hepatarius TaxID=171383 RepID=UPI001C088E82|nr:hypothetical protein [Vibrio hepatarius]MBU2895649.1 hypothetical protein [Vibrio hepatarius]